MRWMLVVIVAWFVVASPREADAQAFKPRAGAKTVKKAPSKAAPKTTPRKKTVKKARAAQSGSNARPDDLTPDADRSAKPKDKEQEPEDQDDYVLIEDDDA